ncbi:MAG: alkaline phosphatase family protein [Lentisphaeria bacterium]|nr:alkaline phosphatase family protein [Lentisphaeria bacterium]
MKAPKLIFIGLDGAVDAYVAGEVAKGNLPNFARLLKRGCRMTDLRPVHPTITPTCWSALQTGSTPEINGITADKLHLSGPISNLVSAYNGTHLLAERFWEAAAREGMTSIVDCLPVSGPRKSELVWQMEGTSSNPGRMVMPDGSREYVDIPQQVWFFDQNKQPAASLKDVVKVQPSGVKTLADGLFELQVDMSAQDANRHDLSAFVWQLEAAEEGFALKFDDQVIPLRPGQWTEPFFRTRNGLEFAFRFICVALEDGYLVFGSAACYIINRAEPEEFAQLLHKMPPTPVHREYLFFANPKTSFIAMDSWNFHMQWHIEMFRRALKVKDPDIIVTYMGDIDSVNHFFWPELSGAKKTTPEHLKFVQENFLKIYEIADRFIGYFLDEVADENTVILTVADHGSIGLPEERDINAPLEKAGLFAYLPGTKQIDWSKTQAAHTGCCHICVNLKSRGGIVPDEEYEQVRNRIIAALQDHMRGPDGASYLAFAVKREEAGFFGLGGKRTGDVVYGLTAGYTAMTVHAEQIPSAVNAFGSMRALSLLSGPGIAPESVWEKPVNSIDLAPTLNTMIGSPLPRDCNGRILFELLDK